MMVNVNTDEAACFRAARPVFGFAIDFGLLCAIEKVNIHCFFFYVTFFNHGNVVAPLTQLIRHL